MFDIAPFLLNNNNSFDIYRNASDICRNSPSEQLNRWVFVAAATRILERLRYQYEEPEKANIESVKQFLGYEYETYKYLVKAAK